MKSISSVAGLLLSASLALTGACAHAGAITGQMTASCSFTPYSGTNGTGSIVSDLTQARSVVFSPATNGFSFSGSFSAISAQASLFQSSPLTVNQPLALATNLWSCTNFSFLPRSAPSSYAGTTYIVLNYTGVIRDGTPGDETVGNTSVNLLLSSYDPTQSTAVITTSAQPKPALTVTRQGTNSIVSWPSSATGFQLQSTASLTAPASWAYVTNTPAIVGTNYAVTNLSASGSRFFRLVY